MHYVILWFPDLWKNYPGRLWTNLISSKNESNALQRRWILCQLHSLASTSLVRVCVGVFVLACLCLWACAYVQLAFEAIAQKYGFSARVALTRRLHRLTGGMRWWNIWIKRSVISQTDPTLRFHIWPCGVV